MSLWLILASNCINFLVIVVCFNIIGNLCHITSNNLGSIYNIIIVSGIYLCFQSHLNRKQYIYLGVNIMLLFIITICLDFLKARHSYWFFKDHKKK